MDGSPCGRGIRTRCPSKSYPKCRLLPRLEEEAPKPTSPAHNTADWPPRGRDREASRPSTQAAPRRCSKNTKARGNVPDLRDILEDKARQTRSIYGSHGRPTIRDDNRHTGYSNSDRDEHSGQSSFELRRDIAQYRGAHTHYASQTKQWIIKSLRVSNP